MHSNPPCDDVVQASLRFNTKILALQGCSLPHSPRAIFHSRPRTPLPPADVSNFAPAAPSHPRTHHLHSSPRDHTHPPWRTQRPPAPASPSSTASCPSSCPTSTDISSTRCSTSPATTMPTRRSTRRSCCSSCSRRPT